ncbi:hypothetical protein ACL6C3_06790 [Capilliphycus salinus ALCB114379]|uniref:hypothetical protein n=1 Tax=Capilliphycus salinus TaxID=2768948 RepID=UPI0039A55076
MYSKLVPLNIPSGWAIVHNAFGNEDPLIRDGGIVNSHFYNENLLLIQPIRFEGTSSTVDPVGYTLKLGWYPHANPYGSYRFTLSKGDIENPVFQYESRERETIRRVIERCFQLITQGVEAENIEPEIHADAKTIEKNQRIFSGTRKRIVDDKKSVNKKNRLTYSQVGYYWPVYYEVSNIIYLEPKSNKVRDDMIAPDNKKL